MEFVVPGVELSISRTLEVKLTIELVERDVEGGLGLEGYGGVLLIGNSHTEVGAVIVRHGEVDILRNGRAGLTEAGAIEGLSE